MDFMITYLYDITLVLSIAENGSIECRVMWKTLLICNDEKTTTVSTRKYFAEQTNFNDFRSKLKAKNLRL